MDDERALTKRKSSIPIRQIGAKKMATKIGLTPESAPSPAVIKNQIPIPTAPTRKRMLAVPTSPFESSDIQCPPYTGTLKVSSKCQLNDPI
ncbi:MAG: hypothetical protein ISR23_05965 [Candidatus Poseidoniaceae archaeon]|nr:hypothetical protein [Candidatus Poseidoniaceae archaeon]